MVLFSVEKKCFFFLLNYKEEVIKFLANKVDMKNASFFYRAKEMNCVSNRSKLRVKLSWANTQFTLYNVCVA